MKRESYCVAISSFFAGVTKTCMRFTNNGFVGCIGVADQSMLETARSKLASGIEPDRVISVISPKENQQWIVLNYKTGRASTFCGKLCSEVHRAVLGYVHSEQLYIFSLGNSILSAGVFGEAQKEFLAKRDGESVVKVLQKMSAAQLGTVISAGLKCSDSELVNIDAAPSGQVHEQLLRRAGNNNSEFSSTVVSATSKLLVPGYAQAFSKGGSLGKADKLLSSALAEYQAVGHCDVQTHVWSAVVKAKLGRKAEARQLLKTLEACFGKFKTGRYLKSVKTGSEGPAGEASSVISELYK